MKCSTRIIFLVLIISSCKHEPLIHNPFNPNKSTTLQEIINDGFNIYFIEELTCYQKKVGKNIMFYYFDHDKNKVIGEGYYFCIDTLVFHSDSIEDKIMNLDLEHNFEKARPLIDSILKQYSGSIISPPSLQGYSKDLVFFARDCLYNRVIECDLIYSDWKEMLYIENFYPL